MAWTRARRMQGKLVCSVMAWARKGKLKNILSVELKALACAPAWHVRCRGRARVWGIVS
ncbi:hypothetical protein HAX54_042073, partial [Datura stramonium]|nr:hypothetical protein [Datura stramonium]